MDPMRIGRYIVDERIGSGGMGIVYRATDPLLHRKVAIKVLNSQVGQDPINQKRFEREVQTLAKNEFPAIVPIYDFVVDDNAQYIVMRWMPGGTLANRIHRKLFDIPTAIKALGPIAVTLDQVHRKGIIHRDIKPANILLDQNENLYLSDFGIAKILNTVNSLTGDTTIGSPAYMSPEQFINSDKVTKGADQYSLGITLFEMLTGQLPFRADTPIQLIFKHIQDPFPDIRNLLPDFPAAGQSVLFRMTSKKPEDRYPDISSAISDLETVSLNEVDFALERKSSEGGSPSQAVEMPQLVLGEDKTDTLPPMPILKESDLNPAEVEASPEFGPELWEKANEPIKEYVDTSNLEENLSGGDAGALSFTLHPDSGIGPITDPASDSQQPEKDGKQTNIQLTSEIDIEISLPPTGLGDEQLNFQVSSSTAGTPIPGVITEEEMKPITVSEEHLPPETYDGIEYLQQLPETVIEQMVGLTPAGSEDQDTVENTVIIDSLNTAKIPSNDLETSIFTSTDYAERTSADVLSGQPKNAEPRNIKSKPVVQPDESIHAVDESTLANPQLMLVPPTWISNTRPNRQETQSIPAPKITLKRGIFFAGAVFLVAIFFVFNAQLQSKIPQRAFSSASTTTSTNSPAPTKTRTSEVQKQPALLTETPSPTSTITEVATFTDIPDTPEPTATPTAIAIDLVQLSEGNQKVTNPQIVVDKNQTVFVAWGVIGENFGEGVYVRYFDTTSTWSKPIRIDGQVQITDKQRLVDVDQKTDNTSIRLLRDFNGIPHLFYSAMPIYGSPYGGYYQTYFSDGSYSTYRKYKTWGLENIFTPFFGRDNILHIFSNREGGKLDDVIMTSSFEGSYYGSSGSDIEFIADVNDNYHFFAQSGGVIHRVSPRNVVTEERKWISNNLGNIDNYQPVAKPDGGLILFYDEMGQLLSREWFMDTGWGSPEVVLDQMASNSMWQTVVGEDGSLKIVLINFEGYCKILENTNGDWNIRLEAYDLGTTRTMEFAAVLDLQGQVVVAVVDLGTKRLLLGTIPAIHE